MSDGAIQDEDAPLDVVDRFGLLWARSRANGSLPPEVAEFLGRESGVSLEERLGVLLIDQRERWRLGSGRLVEDYLRDVPELMGDRGLLNELVHGELSARRELGEILDLVTFVDRFPTLRRELIGQLSSGDIARMAETLDGLDRITSTFPTDFSGLTFPDPGRATDSDPTRPLKLTKDAHTQATDAGIHADDGSSLTLVVDPALLPKAERPPSSEDPAAAIEETVRFSIKQRLGTGGMGVVYEALDRERGEVVALKTMRRVDPVMLYRFKHEFRILSDLSHPNLVSLHELIAVGDLWFFTMERVEGADFVTYARGAGNGGEGAEGRAGSLRAHGPRALDPLLLERLHGALRQLAEALYVLHEAGKLHRDVKPTNVLVTAEGRVVVLDFGLSIDLGPPGPGLHSPVVDDKIVGTVGYMAPEQAAGMALSPASDWYSVGVMLYEALTGRLPFDGAPDEVLVAKQRSDPEAPSRLVSGVPDDLNSLCVELLGRDPESRPSGRAILAKLHSEAAAELSSASWTSSGRGSHLPLIGRERHLRALEAALDTVRGGRPVLLLVSGRSGSGKTTLVQTFLTSAAEAGEVVVLAGRCYERESVPYKALDSVVDALSRYLKPLNAEAAAEFLPRDVSALARMFPVLQRIEAVAAAAKNAVDTPDQQEMRRRAVAALRELLARIGSSRPLVIAVDDLQWGDTENFTLIEDLIRPPDPPRLLLIGSYRTEDAEASPLIRALRREMDRAVRPGDTVELDAKPDPAAGAERRELVVDPLTESESRELALALLARRDAEARAEAHLVAKESHGNPFFIDELVKHIQAGERLSMRGIGGVLGARAALDEVLWERVSRLPRPAIELLEIISVSGRPISLLDAFQAANLVADGRAATAALRAARLIRGTGQPTRDEVETYHDWVRETVVARIPPETLSAHHLRLARVLEGAANPEPERLAVHYQGAKQPERAAELYAKAAARATETLAFFHAAKLYRLALFLRRTTGPADDPALAAFPVGVVDLRTRLADALANAGRGRDAAGEYLKAAAVANPAAALELERRGAMQLLISGHVDEGLAVLKTVLEAMHMRLPKSPAGARASLIWGRAKLRLRGLKFRTRDATQVTAETLALIDLCWSAGAGLSMIQPVRGADFHAKGLMLALRAGEPYRVARSLTLEVMHSSLPGQSARRRTNALLMRTEALASRVAHPHVDGLLALSRGFASLMLGAWKDAHAGFVVAEPILRDRCTGVAWELDTTHHLSLLALTHLGELGTLRRIWTALLRDARERGDIYAVTTLNTFYMAILRLADDEPELALRELDEIRPRLSQVGFHVQHSSLLRARASVDLYLGKGSSAWTRIEKSWPSYRRSLLGRIQLIRVLLTELRGRCALAAAAETSAWHELSKIAERCARDLARERVPWAEAHSAMLRAGVAGLSRARDAVLTLLDDAACRYDQADMPLHGASARRHFGLAVGGQRGQAVVEAADSVLLSQGIRDPARFAAMYAPISFDEEDTTMNSSGLQAKQSDAR